MNVSFIPFFNRIVVFVHAVPSVAWFSDLIKLLGTLYRFVPFKAVEDFFYDPPLRNRRFCHISFDDGEISVYENAFPVLRQLNIPASLFVSPSIAMNRTNYWFQEIRGMDKELLRKAVSDATQCSFSAIAKHSVTSLLKSMTIADIQSIIDQVRKLSPASAVPCNMSEEQLLDLQKSGLFTIGAHTMNHPILSNEPHETARFEIVESIRGLSALLNTRCTRFAYPNGVPGVDFGRREIDILKEEGITIAFSTRNKWIDKTDDPLAVPRVGVLYSRESLLPGKIILGPVWEKAKRIIRRMTLSPAEDTERAEIRSIMSSNNRKKGPQVS